MLEQIILLLILLMLSGFFSSSEIALFSISKTKARYIAKQQRKADILINHMKQDPDKLLSTILVGNNVVNVGAAAIATSLALTIFPNHAVEITTGVMTLLIVLFGEFLPKSFATRNNIMVARITIYPIYWLSVIFYPIVILLNSIVKITGIIKKSPVVTEAELRMFVDVVEEEGEIKEEEKELIYNIFEFDDTNASEIMTPHEPLDLEAIIKSGFTRIPVIDQDLDHVVGIANIKDIFLHKTISTEDVDIRKIMREPYFVPSTGHPKYRLSIIAFPKGSYQSTGKRRALEPLIIRFFLSPPSMPLKCAFKSGVSLKPILKFNLYPPIISIL